MGTDNYMANPLYNWKRFWCPRQGNINLSDDGFLFNPDSDFGNIHNPDTVSFEKIWDSQCLILLGEPGIGKTQSLQFMRAIIDGNILNKGDKSLWTDLRSYGSEDRFINDIFGSEEYLSWLDGHQNINVFLDSLDECLLRINTVTSILTDMLRKSPAHRFFLRINCRTADWPVSFENELRDIWGKENVKVFELAPLRRLDIIEAAKTNKINADKFVEAVIEKDIVSFAIKPITLDMLINIYQKDAQFPATRKEIYLKGCKLLCEEVNDRRRDLKLKSKLNLDEKINIASRIALCTIFANRYAIWTDIDKGNIPQEDIYCRDLCYHGQGISELKANITEEQILETLRTGLFSSRGAYRMGWAHQSYAEYLAAYYLSNNDIPTKNIIF